MKNDSRLIMAAQAVVTASRTTFLLPHKKTVLEINGHLMRRLVGMCDGKRDVEEIVTQLGSLWNRSALRELVLAMRKEGIICEMHEQADQLWPNLENPIAARSLSEIESGRLVKRARNRHATADTKTSYTVSESRLLGLLTQRKSVRTFSDAPVEIRDIVDMVWAGYGNIKITPDYIRKTVPSAGALFPLTLHLVLFKNTSTLRVGVYRVCFGKLNSVGFRLLSHDVLGFVRSFSDPLVFENAHGSIVISGALSITGAKYGARSLLYVPMEAGHAAQNMHLLGSERKVSTVELGGFVDQILAKSIQLEMDYRPLVCIAFGNEATETVQPKSTKLAFEWTTPSLGIYQPPFAIASAKLSDRIGWTQGRDPSPRMARLKAIAEAREWNACGNVPKLTSARIADLSDSAIDPQSVISFHESQYRTVRFPFKPFNEQTIYSWAEGKESRSGRKVFVLADLVYFPYFPKTPYYTYANSSGVAAHPDLSTAIQTSTLELIERDAFMLAYMAELPFPSVRARTLPTQIFNRIKALQAVGFKVYIKDHTVDLAPVICVIAQNEALGYTTCASCSNFDATQAASHALMEVEASVFTRLRSQTIINIAPKKVGSPTDHGELYAQSRYFRRADFLWQGNKYIPFNQIGKGVARSWDDLLDRFDERGWRHLMVPLTLSEKFGGNDGLHIVRSIVPGLVPMTFGYRTEPAGMRRIYEVAKRLGGRRRSPRELSWFPHPFA